MSKLIAKTLEGETVEFDIMDIDATFPDDGVIHLRGNLGVTVLDANSVTTAHEAALKRIAALTAEWDANKLGGVSIQRKRWKYLGEIAREALAKR